jgi:sulfide:quinone oxidoreductase
MDITVAGGGIAGIEGLLALRALAGDRARLTLVAPDPTFTYRPLAVAEPFSRGHAVEVPLARFAADAGAELVVDALAAVDDAAGELTLRDGGPRPYEALLVAVGAHQVAGLPGAVTWQPGGDPDVYGGLLADIDEGYTRSLAVVIPPGAVWPLPAYELALLTGGEARGVGLDDLRVTVVTPEREPLELLGASASAALREELAACGVDLVTGAVARREGNDLVLEPDGRRLAVERVFAIPRLVGPAIAGLEADADGFLLTGADGLAQGAQRTWAAGDGVASPLKFGGLATHQARVAAAAIARRAGATDVPDPGEPVVHGRLLVGRHSRRLRPADGQHGAPLWAAQGKVAGEYLPRWLTEHGILEPEEAPPGEAVEIAQPIAAMGPAASRLYELGSRYRIDDAQLAALGRRIRDAKRRLG